MFQKYKFTTCVVEMRVGANWYAVRETASRGEARLTARILAWEWPLNAVRIREVSRGT